LSEILESVFVDDATEWLDLKDGDSAAVVARKSR